jgi:putative transcriptional regulator
MSEVSEGIMRGLQEAVEYSKGNLDARKIKKTFNPVKESYSPVEIKEIRNTLGMTRGMFAMVIGVSQKTVESWEAGRYSPDGAARRLISVLQQDPQFPEKYDIIRRV